MKRICPGLVILLGIFSVLFSAASSDALVMLSRDTTDIGKIVIVSPQPGDSATANGTALLNALNGITDASDTNPYVLKLGPGIYDVQGTAVQMKEFVDIEGSGEKTTKITGATDGTASLPPIAGTVQGANNAELRFLTVENTSTGTNVTAILNQSASPSILHVTAAASGAASFNIGVCNASASPIMTSVTATASGGTSKNCGVNNTDSSSPIMTNVTATASGGAVNNYGIRTLVSSSPTMMNIIASASGGTNNYGVYNNSSTANIVKINNSVIKGGTNTIYNGTGVTTYVGNSQLDGGTVSNAGTLICVGAYDGSYVALGTACVP